jgi:hypothetical protein
MLKKVFFNRYIVITLLVALAFCAAVKIDAELSSPHTGGWNYRHLQDLDRDREEFSFAFFGDTKNSPVFHTLIDAVNRDDVLFAFDNGDMVNYGGREQFAQLEDEADRLEQPLLTGIGNHELLDQGRINYYDILGPFYYSFTVGNSYFMVLDDADKQGLDPAQMEWLRGELDKSQAYKYRFVIMHVPLYDPRSSGYMLGHALTDPAAAAELNGLFDQAGVTLILNSHIHRFITGTWGKTPYVISGGGGEMIYDGNAGEGYFHYVKVTVSRDGVNYEAVRLPTSGPNRVVRLAGEAWAFIQAFIIGNFWSILIVLVLLYLLLFFAFAGKRGPAEGPPIGDSPPEAEAGDTDSGISGSI